IVYDSGDYALLLDKALAAAKWDTFQAELKKRRAAGELVGAGVGMFVEKSGLGPFDTVRVEVKPDGQIEAITGVASIGQGVETVIAQICADALGMGAFASRVTVMCGEATRLAAGKLHEQALACAAQLMQTNAEALDIVDGVVLRKDGAGPSMTLAEVAKAMPNGLSAEDTFESTHMV